MADENRFLLTIDTDWAPDWMIAEMAETLVEAGVPVTWFVTHDSPVLRDLASEPLFEMGIHPNLLPGSSHGANVWDVVGHMKDLVPSAVTVRTHCLFQSERHSQALVEDFGLEIDCSILLMGARKPLPRDRFIVPP